MDNIGNPCPICPSSDAYGLDDRGWGHCFSCGGNVPPEGEHDLTTRTYDGRARMDLLTGLSFQPLTARGISQETCRRYGYGIGTMDGQKVQVAPYHNDRGQVVAQKVRFADKKFLVTGDMGQARLFGLQLARKGGKRIFITEGEIDALSAREALGAWAVCSLPNGAAGAAKAIARDLEILESHDQVVLAFDNDAAGHAALDECVQLFSPGKVAVMDLGPNKDLNDMLLAEGRKTTAIALHSAREWRPDGVINMADIKDRVKKPLEMGTPYPWAGLNEKLYGFRPGELVVWTAGTGTGKTSVVSELVYHLLLEGIPTGTIYLEEGLERAGKRLVGLHLNKPLHLPNQEITDEEFNTAWEATLGTGLLAAYEHFGSLEAKTLLHRIRYMAKAIGTRVVVLDHVSIVVSGADLSQDERRALDHIMTHLSSLAQETGLSIHIVSHLKRPQGKGHEEGRQVSLADLRGTAAIAQLAHTVIGLERDQQAEDETEKNTMTLRVLKNRYSGLTGPAGALVFNHETGRLIDVGNGGADVQDF